MKSSSRPTNAIDCSARCNVSSIECDECNHCRRRVDVSLTVECATRTTEGARTPGRARQGTRLETRGKCSGGTSVSARGGTAQRASNLKCHAVIR